MAKKRTTTSKISSAKLTEDFGSGDKIKIKLKELYENPAVRYIAAGIVTSAVAKLASSLSRRYPELTRVLTGGLDTLEEKLVEFKNQNKTGANLQH